MPDDNRSMLEADERKLSAHSDDVAKSESALGLARDALVHAKLAVPGKREARPSRDGPPQWPVNA